jgi:hypothetical protein
MQLPITMSASHLKQLIKQFKKSEVPKLTAKKHILHEFADKHGLMGDRKESAPMKMEKKAEKVEKQALHHVELAQEAKTPKAKKMHMKMAETDMKKAEVMEMPKKRVGKKSAPAPEMTKKDAHRENLKKVMALKKSGLSLKEAWSQVKG